MTDYTYRADGVKVKKLFGTTETHYVDGFQYKSEGSAIQMVIIPTSQGYYDVQRDAYFYNFTDHLGNVRLSYSDADGNGVVTGDIVVQECSGGNCNSYIIPGEAEGMSNYYPFGLMHNSNYHDVNAAYQYKYNGKELQESGMYDYGARFYMPDIGRWGVVDPLAEVTPHVSPYHYGNNNPIMFNDPTGMLSQSFMDNIWNSASGTTWYNTGAGFSSSGGNSMDYDGNSINWSGSYTSSLLAGVGVNYISGGSGGGGDGLPIKDIPGITIKGNSIYTYFTGNFFSNNNKESIFNHLDKYIGSMSTISEWDGDRGFRGNWAASDNWAAKLSYGMFNNFYLGLQMVDTFNWLDGKNMSGYTGRITFSNLDGSSQFDSGDR